MAISISNAYRNIISQRYNKNNFYLFWGLSVIFGILYVVSTFFKGGGLLSGIFMIPFIIISAGFANIAIHNRYRGKKGVLPSLINNLEEIGEIGFKASIGGLCNGLILSILASIICVLSVLISSFGGYILQIIICLIVAGMSGLLLYEILCALQACFLKDLSLKEFFNYNKAFYLLETNPKSFFIYTIKLFIVNIIYLIILLFITGIIYLGNKNAANIVYGLLGCILSPLVALFYIDLMGQLLRTIMPLKHRPPAPNKHPNPPQINGTEQI